MAELICLGSSSSGNGYIIKTESEYLLLECGVPANLFTKAINHERSKVAGVLISHCHSDHAKYASTMALKGFDIYSNEETINSTSLVFPHGRIIQPDQWTDIGSFRVYPFSVPHDAENFAYVIRHPELGYLLFATDTYSITKIFPHLNHYMIEANYSDALLRTSDIDSAQRNRLMTAHMSFDYAMQYLEQVHAERADNIILVHLSSRHSNATDFKRSVEAEFGVPCTIADKNVTIDISKLK